MYETILSAYNALKGMPTKALEARAQAISADIAGNASADVQGYAIELEAIERIVEERSAATTATVPELARTAGGTPEDAAGSKEYRSAFVKALQGRELTSEERRAYDLANAERRSEFNTLSNAAAVIPTATLNEIVTKARKQGGIMSVARAFSMPSKVTVPVATPTAAAQWHVEGAAVETEKASTVPVSFEGHEILKVLSISAATRAMSVPAFESYLVEELTASVMGTLAKGMVDGTGEGQATGILTGITWDATNTVTFSDVLTFADVLKCIAMLKRGYAKGASFVMNNATLYQHVYGLTDDNARPIYVADMTEPGKGKILGFDCVVDDYMPDDTIVFGNYQYYGFNMPAGIAVDVSRESSFKSGLVDYRALAIADAKPIVSEAFTKLCKA